MAPPVRLFDSHLRISRAARVREFATLRPGADFLLARAREDLALRLAAVQRPFPIAVDLFSPGEGALPILRASDRASIPLRFGRDLSQGAVADAGALPLAEGALDLVVSLLALQWVEDLPGVLAQVRRALRPDGLFLACLVGGRTLNELRTAFAQAEAETTGGVSPRIIPFTEVRDAGALLQRAGFALPVADLETLTVRYASPFDLMADLRAMGAANPLHERSRRFTRRATILRMAELYAARFADADGRVRATFDLVWLSGWAPHESQQKPLKPGSAQRSLAEALGAREGNPASIPSPLARADD